MKKLRSKNTIRPFGFLLLKSLTAIIALAGVILQPGRSEAQRPIGVDVSHYQGAFNWTNVATSGVSFAWAKATEDTAYVDAYFVQNETNAKAAGVIIGPYHFARPASDSPAGEVTHFWNIAGGYVLPDSKSLMPMLDMEVFTGVTGATNYSDWVNQWCDATVANARYNGIWIKPAIYVSSCNAGNFNSSISDWFADIANYNGNNPQTSNPWTACSADDVWGSGVWHVWQYTDAAIQGDGDVFNGASSNLLGTLVVTAVHPPPDSAAGNDANGIIELFLPNAINVLERDAQTNANAGWGGWTTFGETAYDLPPTVGYNASQAMQLFLRAADNNVWSVAQTAVNGSWGTWQSFGGNVRGQVSVGYLTNGAMQIFARSSSNTVISMYQTSPNGSWSAWTNLGGACFADPVCGANADGRMQLFCQSSTHTLQSNFKTAAGAWFGWADYSGDVYGRPAVANLENGVIEVFVRTSTNTIATLYQTSPSGSFGTWTDMGGSAIADPVVGYNADNRLEIFVETATHTVSANSKLTTLPNSAWSGWVDHGGSCYSDLTVSYNSDGRMQLFIRDSTFTAYSQFQSSVNGPWTTWASYGGNTPAVSITSQPSGQTIYQGQTATFTVAATNVLTYQWRLNGGSISGATNSSYTISNAQTNSSGTYSVVVANNGSSVTSANALLTVNNGVPTITTQPVSQTVVQGQTANFSVGASGTPPLFYQWTFNGGNIAGATSSTYSVVNAQSANAGMYAAVVTNLYGSVTSANASLKVNVPPSITTQPANATVNQGQVAAFSVVAAGTAPLSYQWTFNGVDILGATSSSYSISNVQGSDAGAYAVIVTNVAGSVASSSAGLTVILSPVIGTQPSGQLASVSNNVTFTVGLSQGTSPTYQWQFNGTNISGATSASLTLNAISWKNGGNYSVIVSNSAGTATSANALLTVEQAVFTYTNSFDSYNLGILDRNQTNSANTNISNPFWGPGSPNLSVFTNQGSIAPHSGTKMIGAVVGTKNDQEYLNMVYRFNSGSNYYGNILFEWWFYDTKGTGAGASNYNDYLALVENVPVSATNDFTTTSFTQFNQRMSLGANNTAGFNVGVYQARIVGASGGFNTNGWFNTTTVRSVGWHHARIVVGIPTNNSGPVSMFIDNMTNATLTYTNSGVAFGFNLIEINSSFGGTNTGGYFDDFTLRAANDPWIAQQPANETVTAGQNASFSTVAVGTAYQWQLAGVNISGATKSTYSITNAQSANAGSYTCVVTGANGTIATTPATLTVQ